MRYVLTDVPPVRLNVRRRVVVLYEQAKSALAVVAFMAVEIAVANSLGVYRAEGR
jgi:hypothetical protein